MKCSECGGSSEVRVLPEPDGTLWVVCMACLDGIADLVESVL